MLFDVLQQAILVCAHTEKVRLFFCFLQPRPAIRAASVVFLRLRLGEESLTRYTIPALIFIFIDVTLTIQPLKHMLHRRHMVCIRGSDKTVIGDLHTIPNTADFPCHFVNIRLRTNTCLLCTALNLLPMLICAGQEKHIIPALPLITRHRIRCDCFIGIADVWLLRTVHNRSCNVKGFFFCIFQRSVPSFLSLSRRFRSAYRRRYHPHHIKTITASIHSDKPCAGCK